MSARIGYGGSKRLATGLLMTAPWSAAPAADGVASVAMIIPLKASWSSSDSSRLAIPKPLTDVPQSILGWVTDKCGHRVVTPVARP